MSAEYKNNHYVPQWYQRQFIPLDQPDRELYLLDLKPESFRDGKGVKRQRKALRRTGTRKCFVVEDLYTTRFGDVESRELERVFFGEVDTRGKRAVKYFARYDHDSASGDDLHNMMLFMSTQKLRTPKGLDWLVSKSGARDREDVLDGFTQLRTIYGAIWAECVWQVADASESPTKFIISDHPVTVYNRSAAPGNPRYSKGCDDPDIRLHATHTIFPLNSDRVLILTNRSWACNPRLPPLGPRANPDLFRGAMFNFLDIQTRRMLSEQEVLEINFIIKKRAYRYIAAGREDWLYPERHVKAGWRDLGAGYLLMPNPNSLHPGSEMVMGYADGSTSAMDSAGRLPGDHEFGREARDWEQIDAHRKWREEFQSLFGTEPRGMSFDDKTIEERKSA